jgi:membrane protein DedA with SNARE-associated domain
LRIIWNVISGLGATLSSWGPWGILLLAFIDSAGVPVAVGIDALVILIAAQAPGKAWLAVTMAVVGSMAGNILLFMAARKGGARFVKAVPAPEKPQRFRRWFNRYGLMTVFIPALVPIPLPLKVFVITAGLLHTPINSFVLVVLAARVLRYGGEAWLGYKLGQKSTAFLTQHVWELCGAAVLLAICIYFMLKISERRHRDRQPQ